MGMGFVIRQNLIWTKWFEVKLLQIIAEYTTNSSKKFFRITLGQNLSLQQTPRTSSDESAIPILPGLALTPPTTEITKESTRTGGKRLTALRVHCYIPCINPLRLNQNTRMNKLCLHLRKYLNDDWCYIFLFEHRVKTTPVIIIANSIRCNWSWHLLRSNIDVSSRLLGLDEIYKWTRALIVVWYIIVIHAFRVR